MIESLLLDGCHGSDIIAKLLSKCCQNTAWLINRVDRCLSRILLNKPMLNQIEIALTPTSSHGVEML